MPATLTVPRLGEGSPGGLVAEWYAPDGAAVNPGDPVFRLESGYVALDIEAEAEGIIRHVIPAGIPQFEGGVVGYVLAPGEEMPPQDDDEWDSPTGDAPPPDESNVSLEEPATAGSFAVEEPALQEAEFAVAAARPATGDHFVLDAPALEDVDFGFGEPVAGEAGFGSDDEEYLFDEDGAVAEPGESFEAREPLPFRPPIQHAREHEAWAPAEEQETKAPTAEEQDEWAPAAEEQEAWTPAAEEQDEWALAADEPAPETAVAELAAAPAPVLAAPLVMRVAVPMADAARLRNELAGEWEDEGLRIDAEAIVAHAMGHALHERPAFTALAASIAVTRLTPDGPEHRLAVATGEDGFHRVVRSLQDVYSETQPASVGLVSYASFGIDSAQPRLDSGRVMVVAMAHPVVTTAVTLTLVYDPQAVQDHDAAAFLGRVRELLVQPQALLAE